MKTKRMKQTNPNDLMMLMQQASANNMTIRVYGFVQNARNRQIVAADVAMTVTGVGKNVFYVGKTRYRPFLDQTHAYVCVPA